MAEIIDRGQIGVLDATDSIKLESGDSCSDVGFCIDLRGVTYPVEEYIAIETRDFEDTCSLEESPLAVMHQVLQDNSDTVSSVSPKLMQELITKEIDCQQVKESRERTKIVNSYVASNLMNPSGLNGLAVTTGLIFALQHDIAPESSPFSQSLMNSSYGFGGESTTSPDCTEALKLQRKEIVEWLKEKRRTNKANYLRLKESVNRFRNLE